jgi:MSHA pilin protein MshD
MMASPFRNDGLTFLSPRRVRGLTLIEVVVSITVIGISVAAVLGVLSMLATGSSEAMIRNQAIAIASAYLEEITLKPYADPDTTGGETSRITYDDISDYNGLVDTGARDQLGNPIAGLGQYTVRVTVGAGTLPSIAAASVRRIDVNVQHPSAGVNMTLSGYRTAL